MLSIIVAHSKNLCIGNNEDLLWHLPIDFKWFKDNTLNCPVIMGKNTYLNISKYTNGKPLPGRKNIIVSTTMKHEVNDDIKKFNVVQDLQSAISMANEFVNEINKIFIIGGQKVYEEALPLVDELIITEIDKEFNGNKFFPNYKNLKMEQIFNLNLEDKCKVSNELLGLNFKILRKFK